MCVENCKESSKSYRVNGAASTGVAVLGVDEPTNFRIVTVINDTDIDVRITFSNSDGDSGQFDVPKSIRTFTKALKQGTFNHDFKVAGITANAIGITTFNFGT